MNVSKAIKNQVTPCLKSINMSLLNISFRDGFNCVIKAMSGESMALHALNKITLDLDFFTEKLDS